MEADIAAATPPTPADTLLAGVRALPWALEQALLAGEPGAGSRLPDAALAAMATLRRQVDWLAPEPRLGEALESEAAAADVELAPEANLSGDEAPGELDDIGGDDEAFVAAALRLKRAWRMAPR